MPRANFRGATAAPEITLESAYQAFEETLERIEEGHQAGELDDETADALDEQALADYQAILAEQLGVEIDDEGDEDADYAYGTDLVTFSSGSQLGATLLELGQTEGYETIEDLVEDLSGVTGFDPDDLADLLTGAATVDDFDDPELAAHTLAQAFSITAEDDNAYENFMDLAASEAGFDVEGDDGDGEEDGEVDSVDYSRYKLDLERDRRVNHLEAQFSAAQENSILIGRLMELTREADLGFQEGWLPPTAHRAIVGEFSGDGDRFAAFSNVCNENQVDAETELYAMEKQLEVFQRCGPFVKFGASVEEELSPDEAAMLGAAKASAAAYAKQVNANLDI